MKIIEKSITRMTDDEWSGTLELLLGLDSDLYSYEDISDNLWMFNTRNMAKKERVRSIFDI
jgi:hypothetical protein